MVELSRALWLAERRTGIGGSDAAAVLGLSKWRTPLNVWLDKTGQAGDDEQSEPMRWGTLLEPVIRQEYSSRTGRTITAPSGILRHQRFGWMLANVDGLSDDGRVVEIKTARTAEGWGDPGTDSIPEEYLIQVQHYMAVTAMPLADVAVLIGGSDFRVYTVAADPELQDMMIETEEDFWQSVIDHIAPQPVSYADAIAMFGRFAKKDSAVVADENTLAALHHLKSIRADLGRLESEEEAQMAIVMTAMGENDMLTDAAGKLLATWKLAAAPKRLDGKALAAAHPDIATAFTVEGTASRRFLLKGEKPS